MSKVIKQMQMDSLKKTFATVRDMAFLSIKGLSCQADTNFRAALRKKKIRLQIVKNSLARKVFTELGLSISPESPIWAEGTAVAWGEGSIAEVCRSIQGELKGPKTAALYKDKVKEKGAVAEGQETTFEIALKMPTRQEAIADLLGTILGPGSAVAGCLLGPINQVASQIQQISEKKEEGGAAPPAAG
jgi:large subunit ribosomal protein L10